MGQNENLHSMHEEKTLKAKVLVFTPVNPTRPFYERLQKLHDLNVSQNDPRLFKYVKKVCCLPAAQQASAQLRGVNVCREYNNVYNRYKKDFDYICKWDDDIILPPNILNACINLLEDDIELGGVGLFQEEYGAPNILMTDALKDGWYGAFSRFYMYDMNLWGEIPIDEKRGDPDNAFQIKIEAKKEVLDVRSIHLDHRAFTDKQYKVFLDLASFIVY